MGDIRQNRLQWLEVLEKASAPMFQKRKWRNWQTHSLEVAAPARAWGFKSPLPHHIRTASSAPEPRGDEEIINPKTEDYALIGDEIGAGQGQPGAPTDPAARGWTDHRDFGGWCGCTWVRTARACHPHCRALWIIFLLCCELTLSRHVGSTASTRASDISIQAHSSRGSVPHSVVNRVVI